MIKKDKKYKWNLRQYIAVVSICTLVFSWIISTLITISLVKIFYYGQITHRMLGLLGLFVFIISMIIGGLLIWIGTEHLTRPLLEISEAVNEVAEGNFKVKIQRRYISGDKYQYSNELDELARNVNRMTEELDSMEYMQKDFMSNVSHEIKTPIAAITGFTEILLDGGISEKELQDYLEVINKESMRISRLCDSMLHISRLDSQVLVTEKEKIILDEQIRKCIIMLTEKWSEYNIDFEIDLDKIEIMSNSDMLNQVWVNLIDNAIKYSGDNCKIEILAKEIDNDTVEVRVIDNGIGIEENKRNKIFDKFYQCEESHKKSGNGLGLSIVKRIIELLNGVIECESIEGIGTIMVVRLQKGMNYM